MCLPYANLSPVDFAERAGNNGESVLEQLFDKLFKKALAHVENNKKIVHNDKLKSVERRSGFPWASITSGRTKKQSTLFVWNKVLCLGFLNVCEALISHC